MIKKRDEIPTRINRKNRVRSESTSLSSNWGSKERRTREAAGRGDGVTGRRGDFETWRGGEAARERRGDGETGRAGEVAPSPTLPVSHALFPRLCSVVGSPPRPITPSALRNGHAWRRLLRSESGSEPGRRPAIITRTPGTPSTIFASQIPIHTGSVPASAACCPHNASK